MVGCHTDHCAPAVDHHPIIIGKGLQGERGITRPAFSSHIGVGQATVGRHQPTLATRPSLTEVEVELVEEEVEFELLVLFCQVVRVMQGEPK